MIKNYFKIIWRNFIRDRQFTVLNLLGLSTGLACALLIYLCPLLIQFYQVSVWYYFCPELLLLTVGDKLVYAVRNEYIQILRLISVPSGFHHSVRSDFTGLAIAAFID